MTKQQITDHLHEALNGLTMGWHLANVRDDAQREHLQAPIIAAQDSIRALLDQFGWEHEAAQG
jgi:hypothetical protein